MITILLVIGGLWLLPRLGKIFPRDQPPRVLTHQLGTHDKLVVVTRGDSMWCGLYSESPEPKDEPSWYESFARRRN